MPSDSLHDDAAERSQSRPVARLLDSILGFLVWAIHFLVVYCANALACARGIGASGLVVQSAFRTFLAAVTIAGAAVVIAHAARRWRGRDEETAFMTDLTVGNDAIAAVGIALQLFPLLMLNLCR